MKTAVLSGLVFLALGASAMAQKAPSPEQFVAKAAVANLFEIESSKAALERASSADVKSFAQQMIDDHTKAGEELKQTVSKAGLGSVPDALDTTHKAELSALEKKKGAAFDKAYVAEQRKAHDQAVQLFSTYSTSGTQADLRSFAANTLPTLQMHQQRAKQLMVK